MTEQFAQALIDSAVAQVNKAGFGVVADGTVHGNGIWLNSLRVRPTRDVDPAPPAAEPDGVREAAEQWYSDLCDGHPEMKYNARDVDALVDLINALRSTGGGGVEVSRDGGATLDEPRLKGCGWVQIGNTWYPPESSLPKTYCESDPLVFWVRVDGTLRIARSGWTSENDITIGRFEQVCSALGITLAAATDVKGVG